MTITTTHGEGNGKPLQYSCLENPMDRGAWQATIHGMARVGHDLATKLLLLLHIPISLPLPSFLGVYILVFVGYLVLIML